MSTLLVTLYRLNDAVYTPIDLPYTSIMSLPANDVALVELLLPYASTGLPTRRCCRVHAA